MSAAAPEFDLHSADPPDRGWLAFGVSALLHALAMLLAGWLLFTAPKGVPEPPLRTAGIVLRQSISGEVTYEGAPGEEESSSEQAAASAEATLAALPDVSPGQEVRDALPQLPGVVSDAAAGGGGELGDWTQGGSSGPPGGLAGKAAKVSVFGVTGTGHNFVYVFDRSSSMSGPRLAAAKRELIASLQSLYDTHQFQIIFFNHETRVWDLTGGQRRVPFATEQNKQLAARWVQGVSADGGTQCETALERAFSFRPDVIFFLTDNEHTISDQGFQNLLRKNRAPAAVHVIEFGQGRAHGRENFLTKLARATNGQYQYVNTRGLRR